MLDKSNEAPFSRDKVQKPDLWLLSLLEEGHNANVAWILVVYLSRKTPGIKEQSEICGGQFVTNIGKASGYCNERELTKCSEPVKSETWEDKMFGKSFDRTTKRLNPPKPMEAPPRAKNMQRNELSGLDSS
ncbi:hypothetical protein Tco_1236930 [Tanacetum coccineum]